MKRILITTDVRADIRATFGVANETIARALNYRMDSALSRKIRAMALRKGGQVVDDSNRFDTIHDANGRMIQTWGDGKVRLEVSKETGDAVWYVDGKERGKKPALSVAGLMALQQKLGVLYGSLSK